jgi:hypothetical protein
MNVDNIKENEILYWIIIKLKVYYKCKIEDGCVYVLHKYNLNFHEIYNDFEDMPFPTFGFYENDIIIKLEQECKNYILLNKL